MQNRLWLKRVSVWVAVWVILGSLAFIYQPEFLESVRRFLEEAFAEILQETEEGLSFKAALLIFENNVLAATISLFLGIVFGLVPMLAAALNFFILGFLFAAFSLNQGSAVFLIAVVPHALFEVPAFIISAAFGLRLGFFWKYNLWIGLKQAVQVWPLTVGLFFIAAVVEVFITGRLVEQLMK